jgi:hypothetical protein
VEVKLLPQDQELYVLAQSHARIHKERVPSAASVIPSAFRPYSLLVLRRFR